MKYRTVLNARVQLRNFGALAVYYYFNDADRNAFYIDISPWNNIVNNILPRNLVTGCEYISNFYIMVSYRQTYHGVFFFFKNLRYEYFCRIFHHRDLSLFVV